jgi:hypothetical protein
MVVNPVYSVQRRTCSNAFLLHRIVYIVIAYIVIVFTPEYFSQIF